MAMQSASYSLPKAKKPPLADLEPGFGNLAVFNFIDTNDIDLALPFRKSSRNRIVVDNDIADHDTCQQSSM